MNLRKSNSSPLNGRIYGYRVNKYYFLENKNIDESNLKYFILNNEFHIRNIKRCPFYWSKILDSIIRILYTNRPLTPLKAKRLYDLLVFKENLGNYRELPLKKWQITISYLNKEELSIFNW